MNLQISGEHSIINGEKVPVQPSPSHSWDGVKWVYDSKLAQQQLLAARATAINSIESSVNTIRTALVTDPAKNIEYVMTAADARSYLDANGTVDVPRSVLSWSTYRGIDPVLAAEEIVSKAALVDQAIITLRDFRFKFRKAIEATVNLDEIRELMITANRELLVMRRAFA